MLFTINSLFTNFWTIYKKLNIKMEDKTLKDTLSDFLNQDSLENTVNANQKVIKTSNGELFERINKKIITEDGRQLLRESYNTKKILL